MIPSNINNSIQQYSIAGTHLKRLTYSKSLNCSISPIDGTLTGTSTPDQSGPGSNGDQGCFTFPKIKGLEPDHQIHLSVIIGHLLVGGRFYPSAEMQSAYFTSPTDRAIYEKSVCKKGTKMEKE